MKAGTAAVSAVTVEDRYRRELGDVGALANSIANVGMLHPIVVTSDLRLIAGQRRLEAVRKLGWSEVEIRIADDLDSATALLVAERDENTCRKDMTASELYGLGKALEELERPKARERQGSRNDLATSGSRDPEVPQRTSEIVAPAVGMSDAVWKRLKHVGDRATAGDQDAQAVMDRIDEGKASVTGGYQLLRESDKARTEPTKSKRRNSTVDERVEQIRELASTGHVAAQIATEIGVQEVYVRKLARDADITLPDAAIGKRRRIDSNRIVSETVTAAEGLAFGLDLIAFEELDTTQIKEWTDSLSNSIRALNRLNKQLKETVA